LLFHFIRLAVVVDAGILGKGPPRGNNAFGLPLTAQLEHALKVGGLKSEMQHPTWIAMSVDCGLSLFGYPLHEVAEGLNGAAPVEGLAGSIVQQV
jgi:hypothetical protein